LFFISVDLPVPFMINRLKIQVEDALRYNPAVRNLSRCGISFSAPGQSCSDPVAK
jgi:hypothetical protein